MPGFVLSVTGAYLREAEQRGLTEEKALAYASFMVIIEGLTEKIGLGKLGNAMANIGTKMFGKAITNIGAGAGINAIQEAVIEPISEIALQTMGGSYDYSNMEKRMLQSGIDGAMVYLILGGMGAGLRSATYVGEKVANGEQITEQDIQNTMKEKQENGMDIENLKKDFNQAVSNVSETVKAQKTRDIMPPKTDLNNKGNIIYYTSK